MSELVTGRHSGPKCYACGGHGHLLKNCPRKDDQDGDQAYGDRRRKWTRHADQPQAPQFSQMQAAVASSAPGGYFVAPPAAAQGGYFVPSAPGPQPMGPTAATPMGGAWCTFCHKTGHVESSCWTKYPHLRPAKRPRYGEPRTEECSLSELREKRNEGVLGGVGPVPMRGGHVEALRNVKRIGADCVAIGQPMVETSSGAHRVSMMQDRLSEKGCNEAGSGMAERVHGGRLCVGNRKRSRDEEKSLKLDVSDGRGQMEDCGPQSEEERAMAVADKALLSGEDAEQESEESGCIPPSMHCACAVDGHELMKMKAELRGLHMDTSFRDVSPAISKSVMRMKDFSLLWERVAGKRSKKAFKVRGSCAFCNKIGHLEFFCPSRPSSGEEETTEMQCYVR
jgi:hypothetical protein